MPPKKKEEEPQGPDETEVRQSAVIASTFANLELQTTKKTLQQYVELYNAARGEVARLQREIEERDVDNIKVVKHLREELDRKNDELRRQARANEDELDKAQRRFNTERKQLLAQADERDGEIATLRGRIEELTADLDALVAFKRERHDMHLELSRFKDRQKEETARYEAEIARLRFQSLEEKVRLKAEERSMAAKFDEEVNARAMQLLDGRTRDIHAENYMLLQDKMLLERELETLNAESRQLHERLGTQRRDAELSRSGEAELARKSVRQVRQLGEANNKVATLEANLRAVVEEYEIKLAQLEKTTGAQITALRAERDAAYKNAEARHKELAKMRALSRTVIQQRSELETFFNEALEYVKGEIARERALYLHGGGGGAAGGGGGQAPLPITAKGQTVGRPPQGRSNGGNARAGAGPPSSGGAAAAAPQHPFFQQSDSFEPLNVMRDDAGGRRASSGTAGTSVTPQQQPQRPSSLGGGLPPIADSSRGSAHRGSAAAAPVPPVHADASTAAGPSATAAFRTDISSLSWTDKERVLRILFAKINSAAQARQDAQQQHVAERAAQQSMPLPAAGGAAVPQITDRGSTFLTSQAPDRVT